MSEVIGQGAFQTATAANIPSVTVTVSNGDEPQETMPIWEGILGIEGLPTADRRYLIPGEISERELPLTLMAQFSNEEGHKGAEIAARIDEIWRVPNEERGLNAVEIWGRGPFDSGEHGREAARLVEEQLLRGVSLDLSVSEAVPLDPETFEEIDPEGLDFMGMLTGNHLTGLKGKIMGATLCAHPAFEEATVRIVEEDALIASAFGMRVLKQQALTASAAGLAPLKPPKEWFEIPEVSKPTPLTVTEEGQVYGHLALWGQCHTGFASCETPPHSRTSYSFFHLGEIETAEGETVAVGRITVGKPGNAKGGHASIIYGAKGALEHYDASGCGAAFVRAHDGNLGIWLAGAVRSDLPAERVRDLRAFPPSGDWRLEKGSYELVAVLAVPVPGFPIPRTEMRLVASAAKEEVTAIIATGYVEEEETMATKAELRQQAMVARAKEVLRTQGPWLDEFQDITAEQRRQWAKSGVALPDGSYPIVKCSGEGPSAENAIHAQGRTGGSQRRVVAHIRKRVRSLSCSGDIFDNYK
jgi:hypothetical protein